MKIYVGCALNYSGEEFRQKIEELKNILRKDHEVFDFVGLTKGTPKDVYNWDIENCVKNCDVFVAICDYPSIGLGYELACALEKFQKPTLALAHEDLKVTRLVLGIEKPNYEFRRYKNIDEVPDLVETFVKTVFK